MFIENLLPETLLNSYILKLLVASLLGAIVGFERDTRGRAAGLRTHLLVSLGAAVFMIISESLAVSYMHENADSVIRADPGRIAAQIITGIGFLGAGTIIKSGLSIRGLTTAASLWLTAGIGMSIGAGYYEIGLLATLIGLFALVVLDKIEEIYSKDYYRILEILTSNDTDTKEIIALVKRKKLKIIYLDKESNYNDNRLTLSFTLKMRHKDTADKLSHELIASIEQSGIKLYRVKWMHE